MASPGEAIVVSPAYESGSTTLEPDFVGEHASVPCVSSAGTPQRRTTESPAFTSKEWTCTGQPSASSSSPARLT